MANKSPVSAAFHLAFERHFMPLLQRLGLEPAKAIALRPGFVVALAVRPLGEARRIEATLWCDGGTGANLRFRFDVVEPAQGVECRGQIDLKLPWPNPDWPNPGSLDLAASEFLPHESVERLQLALHSLRVAPRGVVPPASGYRSRLARRHQVLLHRARQGFHRVHPIA